MIESTHPSNEVFNILTKSIEEINIVLRNYYANYDVYDPVMIMTEALLTVLKSHLMVIRHHIEHHDSKKM